MPSSKIILDGQKVSLNVTFDKIQRLYLKRNILLLREELFKNRKLFKCQLIDQKQYNFEKLKHKFEMSSILTLIDNINAPRNHSGNHNVYCFDNDLLNSLIPIKIPCVNFSILFLKDGIFQIRSVDYITKEGYEYIDCNNDIHLIGYDDILIKSNNPQVLQQQIVRILKEQEEKLAKFKSSEKYLDELEQSMQLKLNEFLATFEQEYQAKKEKLIAKFHKDKQHKLLITRIETLNKNLEQEKNYVNRNIKHYYRRIFN